MTTTNITRKQARELALHLIFEMSFQQLDEETIQERLDPIIREAISGDIALYAGELSPQQTNYICRVVTGVAQKKEELNQKIAAYSKGWKIHRLSRITVAILQLALYEMNEVEDVPTGVAINEAINLAKIYDNNEAPAFINGILGAIARAQEQGEGAVSAPDSQAEPPADTAFPPEAALEGEMEAETAFEESEPDAEEVGYVSLV